MSGIHCMRFCAFLAVLFLASAGNGQELLTWLSTEPESALHDIGPMDFILSDGPTEAYRWTVPAIVESFETDDPTLYWASDIPTLNNLLHDGHNYQITVSHSDDALSFMGTSELRHFHFFDEVTEWGTLPTPEFKAPASIDFAGYDLTALSVFRERGYLEYYFYGSPSAAVPEPSTIWLAVCGLVSLIAVKSRCGW